MNLPSPFACLLLLSLPLAAQEAVGPAKPQPPDIVVTLSFRGGPLAELVTQIRERQPRANIVITEGAAKAILPQMELRDAGIDQALESACVVADSAQPIRVKDFRGPGEPVYTIFVQARAQGPEPVVQVRTEVFSLARLTNAEEPSVAIAAATILSAVEAAVGEPQLGVLRYHRESGLMIVRGDIEQLTVVQNVLMNLERDAQDRRVRQRSVRGDEQPPAGGEAKGGDPRTSNGTPGHPPVKK